MQWVGAYGEALHAVVDAINHNDVHEARGQLTLERTIKWKFVLPIPLLRKPPSDTGTKARNLKLIVQCRLHQYDVSNWCGLVAELEADMIIAQTMHHVETRTQSDKDEALIQKAADLLSRFQCSKAQKHLQSNGLGDHVDPNIIDQMKRKHPLQKQPNTPSPKTSYRPSAKELATRIWRPGFTI